MDSKERQKMQREMRAVYEYLKANQGKLQAAGIMFYMLYHSDRDNGIAALGAGSRTEYALMLVMHATAAYYDLYKEEGFTLDQYFDELKHNVTSLLPAMEQMRRKEK